MYAYVSIRSYLHRSKDCKGFHLRSVGIVLANKWVKDLHLALSTQWDKSTHSIFSTGTLLQLTSVGFIE